MGTTEDLAPVKNDMAALAKAEGGMWSQLADEIVTGIKAQLDSLSGISDVNELMGAIDGISSLVWQLRTARQIADALSKRDPEEPVKKDAKDGRCEMTLAEFQAYHAGECHKLCSSGPDKRKPRMAALAEASKAALKAWVEGSTTGAVEIPVYAEPTPAAKNAEPAPAALPTPETPAATPSAAPPAAASPAPVPAAPAVEPDAPTEPAWPRDMNAKVADKGEDLPWGRDGTKTQ